MNEDRAAVLLVDDLPEKLLVLQTVLEGLDADIVCARSGSEALRELLKREFAVVLLDVNMPDIDGFETASLLRSYKQTAHTPIIFMTSYVDEMQAAHGYSLGAVDYIIAPVPPDILRGKVRVFLELFAAQRRTREQAEARLALLAAQAARDAAEATARRLAFLTGVGRLLAGAIEEESALHSVLGLMQHELGGVAALALADRGAGAQLLHLSSSGEAVVRPSDAIEPALRRPCVEALTGPPQATLDETVLAALQALAGDASGPLREGQVLALRNGPRHHGALLVGVGERTPMWDALEDVAQRLAMALENAHLVRSLRGEIAERRAAEQRLTEANQRKDEFLAMLSHELRNPLAPILNASEVVRMSAGGNTKLEWASQVTSRQVDHLRRLIDELLDVARISQGKVTLQLQTLDLRTVVQQGVETVKPLIESRRHALQLDLPGHGVWLRGDPARLTQVVANLLTNAAKYTDDGGRIQVALSVEEGCALLRVSDNGIGIDAELMPRIFDLFEQGRRGLDRSQGGLGVGLTLAQRLVSMHQGGIDAHSGGTGHGAEFRVRLPCLSDVGERESAADGDASGRPTRPERVLVVDDSHDAAESTATVLALAGHDVRVAHDGTEALGVAAVQAPTVVVLDLGLPGMDGYEVAERLRRLPTTRDAMLIALTGYGSDRDRERVRASGFDLHLVKPADPQAVAQAIEERQRHQPSAPDGSATAATAP